MGLISDYFEYNREKYGVFDGGLQDFNYGISSGSLNKLNTFLTKYISEKNFKNKIEQEKILVEENEKLTKLKSRYLLGEKYIFTIKRMCIGNSMLIQDMVEKFLKEIHQSYCAVCELQQKIRSQMGSKQIQESGFSERENITQQEILKIICNSIVMHLKNSNHIMDSYQWRATVCELAQIIKLTIDNQDERPVKEIVKNYLLEEGLVKSIPSKKCQNCGKELFEDIAYCFTCYERN